MQSATQFVQLATTAIGRDEVLRNVTRLTIITFGGRVDVPVASCDITNLVSPKLSADGERCTRELFACLGVRVEEACAPCRLQQPLGSFVPIVMVATASALGHQAGSLRSTWRFQRALDLFRRRCHCTVVGLETAVPAEQSMLHDHTDLCRTIADLTGEELGYLLSGQLQMAPRSPVVAAPSRPTPARPRDVAAPCPQHIAARCESSSVL